MRLLNLARLSFRLYIRGTILEFIFFLLLFTKSKKKQEYFELVFKAL